MYGYWVFVFHKLYHTVFNFLSFIFQGPQFCKNYALGLSKIGLFQHFRVRGKGRDTQIDFFTQSVFRMLGGGGFAVVRFKTSAKNRFLTKQIFEI